MKPFDLKMPTDGQIYHESQIQSQQWDVIRALVIRRDMERCRICGRRDCLEIHHIDYKDFFSPKRVVTLCRDCHEIITQAVNTAKEFTVAIALPNSFNGSRIEFEKLRMGQMMDHALYRAYGELVARTILKLWINSLKHTGADVNMRQLEAIKNAGDIVIRSIEGQTTLRSLYRSPSYISAAERLISEHLVSAYQHYASEGMSDSSFSALYRLPQDKLWKVRRNALKLAGGGGDGG